MSETIPEADKDKVIGLIQTVRNSTETKRTDAMKGIFESCVPEEMKMWITDPSTGLIDALLFILNNVPNTDLALAWAVAIIGRLSASPSNEILLGSRETQIVKCFMNLIRESNLKDNIYTFFGNIILNRKLHNYLLAEEVGLLKAATTEITSNPEYTKVYTFFANTASTIENRYCTNLIQLNIHSKILNRLIAGGTNCESWHERGNGVLYRSILFTTCLTSLAGSRQALRELNPKNHFIELLKTVHKERLYAAMILSNLYGSDEGNSKSGTTYSLLESYPNILPLLMNFLIATMHYDSNLPEVAEFKKLGFAYGVLKMRDITATFLSLSRSDSNKKIMLQHPKFLMYIHEAIDLFINNQPECVAVYQNFVSNAGGGGQDYETVQNLLEMTLQLSFYYDAERNNEHLFNVEFNKPEFHLGDKVNRLLNLSEDRAKVFPFEARQYVLTLEHRLNPKIEISTAPAMYVTSNTESFTNGNSVTNNSLLPVNAKAQHVMLSYSWLCKKEHVIALGNSLKRMGYDVWRDEDGSSLVPPMSGKKRIISSKLTTFFLNFHFSRFYFIIRRYC
jgi:hypothetical protein